MDWTIEYYQTADGKCPVREFIDLLSAESKAKYVFIADLLGEYCSRVKEPYVKPILLHRFTKKTEKTPSREIAIAERRMEEYLSRKR